MKGFDKNGSANIKDNSINQKTLDYARESTYTNSLKGGSYLDWGAKIQTFLNNSPEFRFMAPFIEHLQTFGDILEIVFLDLVYLQNKIEIYGIVEIEEQELKF